MPEGFDRNSTAIIMRSPAVKLPSSHSASPSRRGKLIQRFAGALFDDRQTLFVPGLVALQKHGDFALEEWRLHRVEPGEHPCDGERAGLRIIRQQTRLAG